LVSRVAPLVFGLVCLLGVGVAGLDLRMAAEFAVPAGGSAPSASADAARESADNFGRLVEWPLFGGSATTAGTPGTAALAPLATTAGELPASNAPYRLFGIIASTGSAPRRAILGPDEANQRAYREGDAAPDGATVMSIQTRAVVLSRDGQAEILKLPGDFTAAGEPAPLPGENASAETEQLPGMDTPEAASDAPPPVSANAPIERLRQRIEAARAAAARGEGPAPVFAPPAQ